MASSIGTAALILSTSASSLTSGLDKAKSSVFGFATSVGKSGQLMATGLPGAILGGVSVAKDAFGSIGEKIMGFIGKGADTSRMAESLGIGAELYSSLKAGAEGAGIPAEALTGGLKKFTQNLAESKAGVGEGAAAFQALGLDFAKLKTATPDEAIRMAAEQIARVADPTDRARLAMKAFGEEGGIKLLPLLKNGSAGIDEIVASAKQMGLALNNSDAKQLENTQAAFTKISQAIEGVVGKLAVALAPAFETAANLITTGLTAIQPAIETVGSAVGNFANNFMGMVGSSLNGIADFLDGLEKLGLKIEDIGSMWGRATDNIAMGLAKTGEWLGIVDEQTVRFLGEDNQRRASQYGGRLSDQLRSMVKDYGSFVAKTQEATKGGPLNGAALLKDAELAQQALGLVKKNPAQAFQDQVAGLDALMKSGRIDGQQYATAFADVAKQFIDSQGLGETKLSGAMAQGSKEAAQTLIKAQVQNKADPSQALRQAFERVEQTNKANLQVTKEIKTVLEQIKNEKAGSF